MTLGEKFMFWLISAFSGVGLVAVCAFLGMFPSLLIGG